jgi:hypothetical protein
MTQNDEYTRPATWSDVVRIVKLLNQYEVDFFIVGGYALAAHDLVRNTLDVDIAVSPSPENSKRWVLALSHLPEEATKELIGEHDPFEGDTLHAIRINDEITIDIMPSVAGISFNELKNHRQYKEIQGEMIPVLDLPGLLKTKRTMRPKDQADAAIIEAAIKEISTTHSLTPDDKDLIFAARNFLEILSECGSAKKVPQIIVKNLMKAVDKCTRQSGERQLFHLLDREFGARSQTIKHTIQLEQDKGL